MTEASNFLISSDHHQERFNISPTRCNKSNFKKFPLLRQQNNVSPRAENNLQQALNPLYNSNNALQSPNRSHVRSSTRKFSSVDPLYDQSTINERKTYSIERESNNIKNDYGDRRYENQIIRSNQSPSRVRSIPKGEDKIDQLWLDNESLKQKIRELTRENESIKSEIIQIKEDSLQKYEDLKRKNDELLISFEERHRQKIDNMKENYENEIDELKEEVGRLEKELKQNEELFKQQKEKLVANNLKLEKEKQDLFVKLNQLQFANNIDESLNSKDTSTHLIEQVLREKHEFESQYNDLLSSYDILLDHNKGLAEKLEAIEKEKNALVKKLETSNSGFENEKRVQFQRKVDSPGRIKKNNKDVEESNRHSTPEPKKENLEKTRKSGKNVPNKSSISQMSSSTNRKAREMLLEELRDDITNFEEKLKASTGSLDGMLDPKLAHKVESNPPMRRRDLSASSSLNAKNDKENKQSVLNNKSQNSRPSTANKSRKSQEKRRNLTSFFENEDIKDKMVEQNSMRSTTQLLKPLKNQNKASPLSKKATNLSNTQSLKSLSGSSLKQSSGKGNKVPLYSKIKKI